MTRIKKWAAFLDKMTYCIEASVASLLLLTILALLLDSLLTQFGIHVITQGLEFNNILSKAFTLVIGVEFTKMLCKHTSETVIEVLLFATARQIILSHEDVTHTLIGIIAIAGLFAIKKFLFAIS